MRIAIDAMGGDYAPKEIVIGAEKAARDYTDTTFILYGNDAEILPHFTGDKPDNIEIVHTDEKIESEDDPVRAVRRKREASMVLAAHDVKEGKADALFSCGSTGALVAAGLLIVGRMQGIDRPGLMASLPVLQGEKTSFSMLDIGATADAKPINLYQHAILGSFYAREVLGIENPTVGLLNNGSEDNKGNKLTKEAFKLISEDDRINFIGNVEARDIFSGIADVVVSDGFTGNAVLKTLEGTALGLINILKEAIKNGGSKAKLGAFFLEDSVEEMTTKLDYNEMGGGLLFGLRAPVVKTHGSSTSQPIYNTLVQTRQILVSNMFTHLIPAFQEVDIEK